MHKKPLLLYTIFEEYVKAFCQNSGKWGKSRILGILFHLFTGADPLFRKLRQVEDLEESGAFKVLSGKKGKRKPREKTFDMQCIYAIIY